jgi:WhiB family redox-sensing transcriptional regulator
MSGGAFLENKIHTSDPGDTDIGRKLNHNRLDIFTPNTVETELDWMDEGRCRTSTQPGMWFPEQPYDEVQQRQVRVAKAICQSCPVMEECLAYAHKHNIKFGVWGGTTEGERRVLRQKRVEQRRVLEQEWGGSAA